MRKPWDFTCSATFPSTEPWRSTSTWRGAAAATANCPASKRFWMRCGLPLAGDDRRAYQPSKDPAKGCGQNQRRPEIRQAEIAVRAEAAAQLPRFAPAAPYAPNTGRFKGPDAYKCGEQRPQLGRTVRLDRRGVL